MKKDSFLKSLHLCIFCVIILSKRSSSAHYQYESCTQKNCENGPNITFPFYVGSLQDSYCGYPGFELTCKDGFPVLDLPGNEFVVEHIFYPNRSLRVYNAAILQSDDTTCLPLITRNTTLPIPRFGFVNETGLHLFSKCMNLSEGFSRYYVGCGGYKEGNNGTFGLYDDDENLSDAMERCEENVVVPVEVFGDDERINNGVVNVVEVLRKGFVMNWTASDCSVCEESGGRCGFNESLFHFRCFCPDRPQSRSCKPGKMSW